MRVPRVKSGTRGQSNLMLDEALSPYPVRDFHLLFFARTGRAVGRAREASRQLRDRARRLRSGMARLSAKVQRGQLRGMARSRGVDSRGLAGNARMKIR